LLASFRKFGSTDFLDALLERKAIECLDSQTRENLDAIFQLAVDAEKEAPLLVASSFKGRGIGNSPMAL
jgi:hypothetical protein